MSTFTPSPAYFAAQRIAGLEYAFRLALRAMQSHECGRPLTAAQQASIKELSDLKALLDQGLL